MPATATPTQPSGATPTAAPYRPPGWGTRNVMNRIVAWLLRRNVSVWGARLLAVPGRSTGAIQVVPVNPLSLGDATYLVAPRGETQWVRNLRVAGTCDLRRGRRRQPFVATEVPDGDKAEVLRAYLARWKAEVGVFFDGVGTDSPDEELARIAPNHPVFRLEAEPA
jgi:hypothetical protein